MIDLDHTSSTPPYEQIRAQVADHVASGGLRPGHRLPTVRRLAEDLGLATNTVARAYTELEREGILNTRPGLGVFVAQPKAELTKDARRRRLFEILDTFLTEAVHLGFSAEEVMRIATDRSGQFQWNSTKSGAK